MPQLAAGPTRLAGIDARELGGLQRFPGLLRLTPGVFPLGTINPKWMKYVELQKGNQNGRLRGWVIYDGQPSSGSRTLIYYFYDTEDSVWRAADLFTDLTTSDEVDVTSSGKFLWAVRDAAAGVTFYYDSIVDSAFRLDTFGPYENDGAANVTPTFLAAVAGNTQFNGSGAVDTAEPMLFATRYFSRRRNMVSGMRVSESVRVINGVSGTFARMTFPSPSGDWSHVDVFRSGKGLSRLYFVERDAANAANHDYNGDGTSLGTIDNLGSILGDPNDIQLIERAELWEPLLDAVGSAPQTKRIGHSQGVTVMQLDGDAVISGSFATDDEILRKEEASIQDFVWSYTHRYQPEVFPRTNVHRLEGDEGDVIQFVRAGDFLFGFTPTSIIRFRKTGTRMDVNVVHQGFGPYSRSAAVAIGSAVLFVTDRGVVLLEGGSGEIEILGNVNHLILYDWLTDIQGDLAADPPNIHTAYDEAIGAVFITNNARKQCIVFWTNRGRVSMLEDWPFTLSASGAHPENGGKRRAWFYGAKDSLGAWYQSGSVFYPDADFTGTKQTMWGLGDITVNGQPDSDGTTQEIKDSAGTGWNSGLWGSFVHVWQTSLGIETRQRKQIIGTYTSGVVDLFDRDDETPTPPWNKVQEGGGTISLTLVNRKMNITFSSASGDRLGMMIHDTQPGSADYSVKATMDASSSGIAVVLFARRVRKDNNTNDASYALVHSRSGFLPAWMTETFTTDRLHIVKIDSGGSDATILASAAIPGAPAINTPTSLELKVTGSATTTLTAYANGVEVVTVEDSSSPLTAAGYVGFGATANVSTISAAMVDNFQVVPIESQGTTLNLDTALQQVTSGAAGTTDRYAIAPIPFQITLPPLVAGEEGQGGLLRRRTLLALGHSIASLTPDADPVNSKMRLQAFMEGSGTENTGMDVTLGELPNTEPGSGWGSLVVSGLSVQPGLESYGSNEPFVLLEMATTVKIGDTSRDA